MRDYSRYHFRRKEVLQYFTEAILLTVLISYLFYSSIWAVWSFFLIFPLLLRVKGHQLLIRQRQRLTIEFQETISGAAAALNAGYSIENAWKEAQKEVLQLYGEEALMYQELQYMNAHIAMNISFEELLEDFANRCQIEDVTSFCQVFLFAKRGGGDFNKIIKTTVERIGEKIKLQQELQTDLAARKLESRIMNLVPMGILIYLNLTSPGYFQVLYHNPGGVCIMSLCLGVYLVAYEMSEKMLNIELWEA